MDPLSLISAITAVLALIVGIVTWLFPKNETEVSTGQKENEDDPDDLLEKITKNKQITVGFFHYPPLIEAVDSNNGVSASGLYAEILRSVAIKNGLVIHWKQLNLCNLTDEVINNKVDIVNCVFQTVERARHVDFTAFLHSVAVGGIAKRSQKLIHSQSDLLASNARVVVCRGEIGHEFATHVLGIPNSRLTIIETDDTQKIIAFVQGGQADIAIADSISVKNYLDNAGNTKPVLKAMFRRTPLSICQNGVMIRRKQKKLANWLDTEMKFALKTKEIQGIETEILTEFRGIIGKL